jgi:phosphatidylglycerophosphate synthase
MSAGRYSTGVKSPARQVERDATATVLTGVVVACAAAAVPALVYAAPTQTVVLAVVLGSLPAVLSAAAVLRRRPPVSTVADRVTLGRAVVVSGCAAVTVLVLAGDMPARTWWLVLFTVPALVLDAADGVVARGTGTASEAGARLDYQLDAGTLVVLSLVVVPTLGYWVVLIGAMRYLFVAGSWVRPSWRPPLPASAFRRFVAGLQGAMLAVAMAPVVPVGLAAAAVFVALALLVVSFGGAIVTLERRNRIGR